MRCGAISAVRFFGRVALFTAGAWAAGCAVGPDYQRPTSDVPPAWQPEAPWHEAAPSDAARKGHWWEVFQDPALDPLVEQSLLNHQKLKVAAARLDQARSQVTVARSFLYPDVGLQASAARSKSAANRPLASYSTPNQSTVQNNFTLGPFVEYEFDLFGRVRREAEGYRAAAEQAAADFENTRLMLAAQLASKYFQLRVLDV